MDVIKAVKRISLLTFFLPFGLIAQQANSEYVYVLKDSIGLSSRPSDRSEYTETYLHRNDKLKIIPNKQAVVWQNKAILSDQLKNCENYFEVGQFVLVQKDSLMGYVFDKYLSEFNPSTIQQNQKYNTKSVVDSIQVDEKTYYLNKESVQLTEAIRFESFEDEGCHNLSYIFNQKTNISTILLVAELLYPNFILGVDQLQSIENELQLQLKLIPKNQTDESTVSLIIGIDLNKQTFRLEQSLCD